MKFILDDSKINIDLEKFVNKFELWYMANKHYGYTIDTEKGSIDFSPKSIARIALKTAMAPIALPMINMIYKFKGAKPRPRIKHEDLIDYFTLSFVRYIALFDKDILHVKTVERPNSDERSIISISTVVPAKAIEGPATEEESKESSTRGPTYLRSWKNWHGQNEVDQGDNQEEEVSTTLA